MVRTTARFSTSQILTSPFLAGNPPAAASSEPSGEKATDRTCSACPASAPIILPDGSASRTSLYDPRASSFPSGRYAIEPICALTATRGLILGVPAVLSLLTWIDSPALAPASIHFL